MRKRLTKSSNNVILTGTLAGVAEYFGIDATIVRLIYVLLSFGLIGSPIILYIVMALLIPSGKKGKQYGHDNPYYKNNDYSSYGKKTERKKAEKINDDDWSDF